MLRTQRFWVTQVLIWTIWVGMFAGSRAKHDVAREGAPLLEVGLILALYVGLGLGASTVLAVLYDRFPERWRNERWSSRLYLATTCVALALAVPSAWLVQQAYASTSWQSRSFVEALLWDATIFYLVTLVLWSYVVHASRTSDRYWRVRERLLQTEAQSREARLDALRSQLDAHFLFNSLNTAVGLVEVSPQGAKDVLCDLSALLRRSLDEPHRTTATLREEVDFLLHYLRIEQARFGSDLHLRIDVDGETAELHVPAMLLQPLVENAVKHGREEEGAMTIEIRAASSGSEVRLEVVNSGSLAQRPAGESPRAGLRLVRQRLTTRYPKTGRFSLREEDDAVVARVVYDRREELAAGSAA